MAMVADRRLSASEFVWREGMTQWMPFSQVPELSAGGVIPSFQQGNPYSPPQAHPSAYRLGEPSPPSYLWQSIVVTLLCCLPFGIPAIVYASRVESLAASGDLPGARKASANAKTWCWVSFGLGLAITVVYVLLAAGGVLAGARH